MEDRIGIIGAGLVGSLHAMYLAQKGLRISVFERRPDVRNVELVGGRSINLALSDRGWKALERVGLDAEVRKMAIPMHGRVMHAVDGTLTYQPYGKEGQAIYSVSRGGLNQLMLRKVDELDNAALYFDRKCRDIDVRSGEVTFEHTVTGEREQHTFDRIFGTDGAFSAVRSRMQRRDRFNYSQTYLTHGYKELEIPPNADGTHKMEVNALHIWPRGEYMLIALPNLDGSYTVTLFFPFEGPVSFDSLDSDQKVMDFFTEVFPDALDLMPDLIGDWHANPTSSLVTISCSPWNIEDRVLLMGDASHAIVPFYGQGMNSGFEDCRVFDDVFEANHRDWAKTFEEFNRLRVPAAEGIKELALQNYIEMRDLTADPRFLLQKKIEKHFSAKHPERWLPLYGQVTFSHIPYHEALAQGKVQDAIMKRVMDRPDIEAVWDSEEVERAILAELEA